MQQLVIAGAGPAGVSAALYAVRMGFPPLVIHNGYGALEKAEKIENYYGLHTIVSKNLNKIKELSPFENF